MIFQFWRTKWLRADELLIYLWQVKVTRADSAPPLCGHWSRYLIGWTRWKNWGKRGPFQHSELWNSKNVASSWATDSTDYDNWDDGFLFFPRMTKIKMNRSNSYASPPTTYHPDDCTFQLKMKMEKETRRKSGFGYQFMVIRLWCT